MNPKTTITFRGERDVGVIQGISENFFRARVFLCASANGAKLPAFIVFAGAEGGPVHYELLKNELHKNSKVVWLASVTYCHLLLLDSLKVHKIASVRAEFEKAMTSVEFVPVGVTGLAQPMDVSVMRDFKRNCRELYVRHHMTHDFSANATARCSLITAIVGEA
ncbi:Cytochrome P450 [Phytophthora megakarya]|uniref:Cytochrome P450 n=1 Tax=Phytophthora megakarya TaxID=4795 RepID=A0A225WTS9_9STRA|nr:Cytochrome P450 [Phytophthora megakarya]